MAISRRSWFYIAGILLLAAAWKLLYLLWDVIPFNADEAVVALMARHIQMGERPVFFYGQAYMGSLDAYLTAVGFGLFGQQIWVLRLVQLLLYLGTLLTTILIGREAFGTPRAGLLAGLLLAIPTVNVTLYTTASLGGYGEALLIGNLLLLIAIRLVRRNLMLPNATLPWMGFLAWGFLAGLGLWANGLTLVYSLPAGLYLLWAILKQRRGWLAGFLVMVAAGFLLGALPWWLFALAHGPRELVLELLGTAVAVENTSWLARTGAHLVNFFLLGTSVIFGFRPPWSVRWLGLPLLPFVLMFWIGVLWFVLRQLRKFASARPVYALLLGVAAVLLAGFLFTPFGIDPSGRYFLPLAVPLALIAAQAILHVSRRAWHTAALLVLVVGYQMWGSLQCASAYPPGLTTQFHEPTIIDHRADAQLMAFLSEQGETRGYASYWTAYPLAFQSAEALIFIPGLPYHFDFRYNPRDDRYAPYTALVESSPRVAYITARNPGLDAHLTAEFTRASVTWQEKQIGDYHIYYALSRVVRPSEIGLGVQRK